MQHGNGDTKPWMLGWGCARRGWRSPEPPTPTRRPVNQQSMRIRNIGARATISTDEIGQGTTDLPSAKLRETDLVDWSGGVEDALCAVAATSERHEAAGSTALCSSFALQFCSQSADMRKAPYGQGGTTSKSRNVVKQIRNTDSEDSGKLNSEHQCLAPLQSPYDGAGERDPAVCATRCVSTSRITTPLGFAVDLGRKLGGRAVLGLYAWLT